MRYRYNLKDGAVRIRSNVKKYILSSLAILVLIGGLAVPALAEEGGWFKRSIRRG